jgi:hypothetical protein
MMIIASALLGLLAVVVAVVAFFLYRKKKAREYTEIIVVLKEGETLNTLPIDKTNIVKTSNTFGKVMFSLRLPSYEAEQSMNFIRSLPQVKSVGINGRIRTPTTGRTSS